MRYNSKSVKKFTLLLVCCFFMLWNEGRAKETQKIDAIFAHMPKELLGDALNKAIANDDLIGLELFLDLNVSPDIRGHNGVTPLIFAVFMKRYRAVAILLSYNASLTEKVNGLSPLDVAEKMDNKLLVYMLKAHQMRLKKRKK